MSTYYTSLIMSINQVLNELDLKKNKFDIAIIS